MSKFMMLQWCLFCLNFMVTELAGQIVFSTSGKRINFSVSNFNRFHDCMRENITECTATYNFMYNKYIVHSSGNNNTLTGNIYYVCTVYPNLYSLKCTANILTEDCLKLPETCTSNRAGVVLQKDDIYISGDNIMNCSILCWLKDLTFYYRSIATTTSTTVPTTTTTTTTTEKPSSASSTTATTASINTNIFYPSTTHALRDNSSANVSGIVSNNDTSDDIAETTLIISVCVVGAVVLVLCFIIGIFVWRRHQKYLKSISTDTTLNNHTPKLKSTTISKRVKEIEHATNTKDTTQDPPDLVKTVHKLQVTEYFNCLAETDYTTIVEVGDMQAASTGHENLDQYANTMTISSNSIDSEWEVKRSHKSEGINQESQPGKSCNNKDSTLDYYNSAESTSSDYQRLGQELRDLKNPYQQLLQVEQEQQLVLSDQELSPYTLAKPVVGEATLQIIDVKVCDKRATSEDQPYNNTPDDDEIQHVTNMQQHEPTVKIRRNCLGYTMILPMDKK
ncbi:uncharacterized protein LOC131945205 [Physella acuta]|uniref:uncharacterized protein LOC131945205 n=1 Tax=Physella acuta TaxID=109671 RepID=UPI0027DB0ACF|nr:uncharacterized protein LOC131945205 [Physella acuta]